MGRFQGPESTGYYQAVSGLWMDGSRQCPPRGVQPKKQSVLVGGQGVPCEENREENSFAILEGKDNEEEQGQAEFLEFLSVTSYVILDKLPSS